jgi:DNA adenine methylase
MTKHLEKSSPSLATPRPFLRWAGGKQKVVKYLLPLAPHLGRYKHYYEPFLGGGSLFFALTPQNAILSDNNIELINCYRQVARFPMIVSKLLQYYAHQDCPKFFYGVRTIPIKTLSVKERAARFIYLNKAAFNGIYRVNRMGQFNVPYGPNATGIAIPSEDQLIRLSKYLRKAKILSGDFEKILSNADAGDFVYLDPPYPPRNNTSFFNHYSADRFSWEDQIRVARVFRELSNKGCLLMLSNSDQKRVIELYEGYRITRLNVIRWLGSNGDRFRVREVVVTNYNTEGGNWKHDV